jgi:hypothetical protein
MGNLPIDNGSALCTTPRGSRCLTPYHDARSLLEVSTGFQLKAPLAQILPGYTEYCTKVC